jgi:hypothetical protein
VISHFVFSCCSEEHISLYYNVCCTLLKNHEHKWTPGLRSSNDVVFNHVTMHISRLAKLYNAVFLLPKCDNASKQIYRYSLLLLDFVHRVKDIKHKAIRSESRLCFRLQVIDQAIPSLGTTATRTTASKFLRPQIFHVFSVDYLHLRVFQWYPVTKNRLI